MGAGAWGALEVEPLGAGRYRAEVHDDWVLAMVPQGGFVQAVAASAMAAELGTEQPLRSIHGVFARPVPSGSLEVDVRVLRRGRSASQVAADVRSVSPEGAVGEVGLSALAVFGGDRPGFAFTELVAPAAPPPDGLPSWRDPPPPESGIVDWDGPWPFWGRIVEGRTAIGHAPWDPSPRGAAEVANWFRLDEPPLTATGDLDPLALLVLADVMPGSVFERIGPTEQRWFSPSTDLTVHLFGHASPGWILAHARAHHAGDGYASAEMALWDPRPAEGARLVAWACQQMVFTRIS
jgi:acyl-CoA thioesterase